MLKDGRMQLATWSQDFEHMPTIGERVDVSGRLSHGISGYGDQGMVSRVEMDPENSMQRIDVEAECELKDHQRPVVFLNANLVPARDRAEVEDYLRSHLDLPILDWENSLETQPIVRVHTGLAKLRTPVPTLQAEIRNILMSHSELSHC